MKKLLVLGLFVCFLFSNATVSFAKEEIVNGKAIKLEKPKYPKEAKEAGISGVVKVKVMIDEEGKVIKAEAIEGEEILRQPCVEAALNSTFQQTKIKEIPVKVTGIIVYSFTVK